MSNLRDAGRKSWIKMSQLKGAMRTLKNVRVVAERLTDNAPPESLKVRRALLQSNTSLNQGVFDICLKTQATSASYAAEQVPRETQLQQREERENIPPEEENDEMLDAHGNGRTTAKLDRANARHDYPFKRRKDSDNSVLSAMNQPDAFNGTSALRLRTLRSPQKQVPREIQLQQGEERETNISAEEENHDMLDAQGNDSRTTGKNFYVPEFIAAFYLSLRNHNMFRAYVFYGHLCEGVSCL
ncbi:hypothetical protein Cgig2_015867 [Carnegiea gigantea]|uniref:Uncharacterized protein n=1 Tax=Carnegiea gigantea TaxID=171969 RepID=A0A9Q1JJS8_9CARY|nr:hypothetical protein Cgig2_015867 [Carnegiea gigantea]